MDQEATPANAANELTNLLEQQFEAPKTDASQKENKPKSRRGFASMDPEKRRAICSKGGKAAHQKGTAHEFSHEEAVKAGRKGGLAVHAKGTAHKLNKKVEGEAS